MKSRYLVYVYSSIVLYIASSLDIRWTYADTTQVKDNLFNQHATYLSMSMEPTRFLNHLSEELKICNNFELFKNILKLLEEYWLKSSSEIDCILCHYDVSCLMFSHYLLIIELISVFKSYVRWCCVLLLFS